MKGWTAVLLACPLPVTAASPAAATVTVPVAFAQEALSEDGGSRIVLRTPDGELRVLTESFAAAADPSVSFDGQRILFAGRSAPGDPWDVWEMNADGSAPRRITSDLGDCRQPIYLPRAAVDSPNFDHRVPWITFTSTAPGVLNDQGTGALTSLYATNLEPVPGRGTVLWRTTHNLGGDLSPTLLSDGRVLHSARQRGALALMAMSWSGENLNPFFGSHDGFVSQIDAVELSDRAVVFVEADRDARGAGGRLARVSLRRPLHSREILAEGPGSYRAPAWLAPGGTFLVSYAAPGDDYGLYVFDADTGERELLHDDPDWHDVDAVAIAPRVVPPARIPTVEFASVLDVGGLKSVGQLQCLNVYDSDRPEAVGVARGDIRTMRFVEGRPRPVPSDFTFPPGHAPDSTWPPPAVDTLPLGEVTVEEDGSFYVNVAGDLPFYLEALDADGRVVRTMRTWMWVRAGDQRGCIGCHEDKELTPENRASMALIRADPPTLLPEDREAVP